MKILMVINCLSRGGRERRMLELIKGLTEKNRNLEVYLISLSDRIDYKYVYDLPIKFEIINKKEKDLGLVFKLRKIIKQFNPDVIHSWDVMSTGYLTAANLFLNKIIVNGVIYDSAENNELYDRQYFKVKLFTAITNVTVANSKAGLRAYKSWPKKSVCIHNGINLKRFTNLKPAADIEMEILGEPKGDHYIGAMVAAFENRKDHDTLIKAAVQLCSRNKKFILLLIGQGSLMESIRQQVPADLLNKQIYFLGSRTDIESILQIIDVGLLITPREGLSNSIMEYMASSKPVIASKDGGTAELVTDGKTGFLVEQKQPAKIVEKLEWLMQNPEAAKQMGCNGLKRIEDHFDVAKMTDSYLNLYVEQMNKRREFKLKKVSFAKS